MKPKTPPKPNNLKLNPALKFDPQVIKWTQRLLGDPDAKPKDLDEEQLAFIVNAVSKARGLVVGETAYAQAMQKTCPQFAAPDFTDLEDDLAILFDQPEMKEFWERWTGPTPKSGPAPNYAGSKMVMATLGIGGISAHVDTVYERVKKSQQLQGVFSSLENTPIELPGYSSVCRHLKKLGSDCTVLAIETNIEMMKKLREMFPKAGIGKRLLIDSCDVPAWCEQKSSYGNEDLEAYYRRRNPNAGFRAYSHTKNGKEYLKPGSKADVVRNLTKRWRGYYFSVIVDQATGLPLVWWLQDSRNDEARALVPLLSKLHQLWPDIDAETIAGDSAWDEAEWVRLCEVDYGIHPIFRAKPSTLGKATMKVGEEGHGNPNLGKKQAWSRDGSVDRITSYGRLVCAIHGQPLDYDGFDAPTRVGLDPGKSNDARKFRVRGICRHVGVAGQSTHPCGRLGLKAGFHWTRLTFFPHHPHGHPERYAMREAMLVRLNQVEGLFNRLKAGKVLGNQGAARLRVTDDTPIEGLFSLACLSMTASLLAEQRGALQPAGVKTPVKTSPAKTVSAKKPKPAVTLPIHTVLTASVSSSSPIVGDDGRIYKRGRRRVAA